MDLISNAFSVLALEDGDGFDDLGSSTSAGVSGSKSKGSTDNLVVENGEKKEQNLGVSAEYKLPLVWIDLEMTGLNTEVDRILEIACIITDGNLSKSVEGPDLVIHQSQQCLDKMGDWCQEHHGASGHRICEKACWCVHTSPCRKLNICGLFVPQEVYARVSKYFPSCPRRC